MGKQPPDNCSAGPAGNGTDLFNWSGHIFGPVCTDSLQFIMIIIPKLLSHHLYSLLYLRLVLHIKVGYLQ